MNDKYICLHMDPNAPRICLEDMTRMGCDSPNIHAMIVLNREKHHIYAGPYYKLAEACLKLAKPISGHKAFADEYIKAGEQARNYGTDEGLREILYKLQGWCGIGVTIVDLSTGHFIAYNSM